MIRALLNNIPTRDMIITHTRTALQNDRVARVYNAAWHSPVDGNLDMPTEYDTNQHYEHWHKHPRSRSMRSSRATMAEDSYFELMKVDNTLSPSAVVEMTIRAIVASDTILRVCVALPPSESHSDRDSALAYVKKIHPNIDGEWNALIRDSYSVLVAYSPHIAS